jgi:SAM-dependent methyltransferase
VYVASGTSRASLSADALRAYEAIADGYDAGLEGDAWMRRALHAHYLRVFKPADRVLDVGCGTGTDAIFLARHGVHVVGIDASPAMIERLHAKLRAADVQGSVETHVTDARQIGSLPLGRFDGVISSFASLNTLPDLQGFAGDATQLLRCGGRMVLHILNRFSAWEFMGLLAQRRLQAALALHGQHSRVFAIGGVQVTHELYSAHQAYRCYFKNSFRLRDAYSLGALRPPHTLQRLPAWSVALLGYFDVRAGRLPGLINSGRFFVVDLERR